MLPMREKDGRKQIDLGKIHDQEVFSERRSLIFKELHVRRFYDSKRNTLVYLTYSDKLIEGSPKNSISVVPIRPWPLPVSVGQKSGVRKPGWRFRDRIAVALRGAAATNGRQDWQDPHVTHPCYGVSCTVPL